MRRTVDEAVSKKLCVLYDKEIPRNLTKWNATKVSLKDVTGKEISIPENELDNFVKVYEKQIESSPVYSFFKNIVADPEIPGSRDLAIDVNRTLLRRQTVELIKAFQASKRDIRLEEELTSVRLTITIPPFDAGSRALQPQTEVVGYDGALSKLFGIAASPTTWQAIIEATKSDEGIVPLWIEDLENSCDLISKGMIPARSDILCVTRTGLFIPEIIKFVPFTNGKKEIVALAEFGHVGWPADLWTLPTYYLAQGLIAFCVLPRAAART